MFRTRVPELGVEVVALSPKDGERYGSQGWSLAMLETQEDVGRSNLSKGIYKVLREAQIKQAFAPYIVPPSGKILNAKELTEEIKLGGDVVLCRGDHGDGLPIGPGQAFVMSSGGCPVIVAKADRQMIVAHAGRDSLVDRGAVMGKPKRKNVSVVHSIVEAFAERGVCANDIIMCMMFSIPAELFGHPLEHEEYGEFNRALATFVNDQWPGCAARKNGHILLDLEGLFQQQADQLGVYHKWVMHSLDEHPSMAHTHDGKDPKRRNLIVVKRLI